jgi:hypothetical protein
MPKLDRSSFDTLLRNLYQIKDTKISDLKGEQKNQFDSLVNFVKILYGTPYFQMLYQKINEVFGNIQEIKPGTVSGYILGSILSRSFYKKISSNPSDDTWACSPFSLNALPVLNQPECKYFVITLEPDATNKKGYNMIMNKSSNEDKAIIFTMNNFVGLTNEDKTKLKNYGIAYVKVFKIGPKDFLDIVSNWTPVDNIQTIANPGGKGVMSANNGTMNNTVFTSIAGGLSAGPDPVGSTGGTGGLSTGMIALIVIGIIVVFVIIIVGVLIWISYMKREEKKQAEPLKSPGDVEMEVMSSPPQKA